MNRRKALKSALVASSFLALGGCHHFFPRRAPIPRKPRLRKPRGPRVPRPPLP